MSGGAPRVLVVDDDRLLVPLVERGLRYEGFEVACAYCAADAVTTARAGPPDLVLLDIGMPDGDGFAVLRELRRHSDVPVVMLTARDEVSDKVGALDLGADDYVAKPFAFEELMARIRAVLRRRGADALDRIGYDDLSCDLGTRDATRAGRRIFDRFYRGRNSTAATGTGLSLAIARWVVEQHDGRIELTSSPTGSRFSMLLPLAAASDTVQPGSAGSVERLGGGLAR